MPEDHQWVRTTFLPTPWQCFTLGPDHAHQLAWTLYNLASLDLDRGRRERAMPPMESAARILEEVVRDAPGHAAAQRQLERTRAAQTTIQARLEDRTP